MLTHLNEPVKHVGDASAALIALGTLAKALPALAALLTIVWLAIRIWESDTVRGLTNRALTGRRADD
jgi:hypothetical protein